MNVLTGYLSLEFILNLYFPVPYLNVSKLLDRVITLSVLLITDKLPVEYELSSHFISNVGGYIV